MLLHSGATAQTSPSSDGSGCGVVPSFWVQERAPCASVLRTLWLFHKVSRFFLLVKMPKTEPCLVWVFWRNSSCVLVNLLSGLDSYSYPLMVLFILVICIQSKRGSTIATKYGRKHALRPATGYPPAHKASIRFGGYMYCYNPGESFFMVR
jgi:hypothetical protein